MTDDKTENTFSKLFSFSNEPWGINDIQMEKAMAPYSSTLAWKIPWTEEPGGLQFMGSLRVGHDWATSLSLSICLYNYAIIYNCICICICETNSKYFNHFSKFPWALCNPPSLYSHPQETTNLISVTIIWIFWNVI